MPFETPLVPLAWPFEAATMMQREWVDQDLVRSEAEVEGQVEELSRLGKLEVSL